MHMTLRRCAVVVAMTAIVFFGCLILSVVVFNGINLEIGAVRFRSTTLESPVIGFLASVLLLLIFKGKPREAILLCGSLVTGCLLAEGLLRILDHPLSRPYVNYSRWYEPSDLFGHQLVPNFEGYGPLNVLVKTNSAGFRDREHAKVKKRGTLRILGLGDSFTFGWGVAADESFLSRLEKLLHDATGKDVEVINTGVPGWGLNQYYLYLKERGVQHSPDVVILNYFVNNNRDKILETIPAKEKYQGGLHYEGGFLRHLRVYNFAKSLSVLVKNKNRRTRVPHLRSLDARRHEWSSRERLLLVAPPEDLRDQYHHVLNEYVRRIQQIAHDHQALFMILLIPDIAQLHHPETQYINHVIKNLSVRYDIPFVDMTPIFEQAPTVQTYYLWPEDAHTNVLGHLKIAETLIQILCQSSQELSCSPAALQFAGPASSRKAP